MEEERKLVPSHLPFFSTCLDLARLEIDDKNFDYPLDVIKNLTRDCKGLDFNNYSQRTTLAPVLCKVLNKILKKLKLQTITVEEFKNLWGDFALQIITLTEDNLKDFFIHIVALYNFRNRIKFQFYKALEERLKFTLKNSNFKAISISISSEKGILIVIDSSPGISRLAYTADIYGKIIPTIQIQGSPELNQIIRKSIEDVISFLMGNLVKACNAISPTFLQENPATRKLLDECLFFNSKKNYGWELFSKNSLIVLVQESNVD